MPSISFIDRADTTDIVVPSVAPLVLLLLCQYLLLAALDETVTLERVLSRELLVAVCARIWLHG